MSTIDNSALRFLRLVAIHLSGSRLVVALYLKLPAVQHRISLTVNYTFSFN